MKDRTGRVIKVGDTVRFSGRGSELLEGKVQDILHDQWNGWDRRRESVAVIERPKDDVDHITMWKRYGDDVELV